MFLAQAGRHQPVQRCWAQRHHLPGGAQQHRQGGGRGRCVDFVELQGRSLDSQGPTGGQFIWLIYYFMANIEIFHDIH